MFIVVNLVMSVRVSDFIVNSWIIRGDVVSSFSSSGLYKLPISIC